jgi:DNA repair protein RadC
MGKRNVKTGHRQRLRQEFIKCEGKTFSEEALLELLLTYAIPQRDVLPLAQKMLVQFEDLDGVFSADFDSLCEVKGVKEYTGTLIKLVDLLRCYNFAKENSNKSVTGVSLDSSSENNIEISSDSGSKVKQAVLFKDRQNTNNATAIDTPKPFKRLNGTLKRQGSGMFARAVLKEAIELLPMLPETDSLAEIQIFLYSNLHFSAEQTRKRFTYYIVSRMFPDGYADRALRVFAQHFAGSRELQDVCYYRFCKKEQVMLEIIDDLLLASIGSGRLERDTLRAYLEQRLPNSKSINDYSHAIVEALTAGGIVKADNKKLKYGYREVPIHSFAFILHSEFPEPGMYDISEIEQNPFIRVLLWNPDKIITTLYELRNYGLLPKVSEIDSVRQFTTRWTLEQVVDIIVRE